MPKNAICRKPEVQVISSVEVAEMIEKPHDQLLRTIRGYVDILQNSESAKLQSHDFFIPSTYINSQNKEQPCYLLTKKGCDMVANKMTGEKGIIFTAQYVTRFADMEQAIIRQATTPVIDTKSKEIEARLINARVREASIYLKIADKVTVPTYQQICYVKATEVLNNGQALLPLPKTERPTYSATEIGEKLGITSNKVGSLANKHNLKTEEYGIEVWDKSKYSSKQVATWRYYENVISVFEEILKQERGEVNE